MNSRTSIRKVKTLDTVQFVLVAIAFVVVVAGINSGWMSMSFIISAGVVILAIEPMKTLFYYFSRIESKREEVFIFQRGDSASRGLSKWSIIIFSGVIFLMLLYYNFDFKRTGTLFIIAPMAFIRAFNDLFYAGYSDGLVFDRKGVVRQKFYLKNIPWENINGIALDQDNSCIVFYHKSYKSYFNFLEADYDRVKSAVYSITETFPEIEVKEMSVMVKEE
ncbi:MAG: hypothetical protein RL007_2432 [Bacteroidota bacterium]|jgi:hypothetical protein